MTEISLTQEKFDSLDKLYVKSTERFNPFVLVDNMSVGHAGWFIKLKIRKSIGEFEKCLSIIPNLINSIFWIGKCYQSLGEDTLSLKWFVKSSKITYSDLTYEEEEAKYKKLIQYSHIKASVASAKINNFEGAIKYSKEVLKHDPNNYSALGNIAMSHIIKEQDGVSEKTISRALEIKQNDFINNKIAEFTVKLKDGSVIRPKIWNEVNV